MLDTWFSSGLWPFSTLGWPEETPELKHFYPGDVLVTGFDIIFFWVARMMMLGIHFMGEVPFRTIYIHGLVRDKYGRKISKTIGNVIDPLDLIEAYGTDALRFTLAALAAPVGRDVKLDDQRIAGYRNFGTKLWNASRFALMNGAKPDPAFDPAKCKQPVNRWIVGKLSEVAKELDADFAAYRFNDVADRLYHFTWDLFCDWYVEFSKPIMDGSDKAAAETRATMAWVLEQILRLLHPVMPFITEELWSQTGEGRNTMLIAEPWPALDGAYKDPKAEAEMDWVIRLVSEIRAVRAEINVPPAAKLDLLFRDAGPKTLARLKAQGDVIRRLARVEKIEPKAAAVPEGSTQIVVDEATVVLPLAGVIDMAAERGRLSKEIGKLEADAGKMDKKLANPQFLEKAPETVVAELKERRAEMGERIARLEAALKRLD